MSTKLSESELAEIERLLNGPTPNGWRYPCTDEYICGCHDVLPKLRDHCTALEAELKRAMTPSIVDALNLLDEAGYGNEVPNSLSEMIKKVLAELKAAEDLAYMGEHHFPDATWKARCMETVEELKAAQRGANTSATPYTIAKNAVNAFRAQLVETMRTGHIYRNGWTLAQSRDAVIQLIQTFEPGEVK